MYTVQLKTFEGPLELLLDLIEKDKLDISDISLAEVTGQFLEYTEHFQEKDPGYLADFLVIAAKLILIKSRTLLPFFAVTAEEEQEITELKDKLALYREIRAQARVLGTLERTRRMLYHRPSGLRNIRVFAPPEGVTGETLAEVFGMLCATRTAEKDAPREEQRIDPVISFEEKIADIRSRIEQGAAASFRALAGDDSKTHRILSFLAVLELVRQKFMTVHQQETFGDITLVKL
ncbi:MAG: segregation/condensation protein A [Patescibacteria group bacterium]